MQQPPPPPNALGHAQSVKNIHQIHSTKMTELNQSLTNPLNNSTEINNFNAVTSPNHQSIYDAKGS